MYGFWGRGVRRKPIKLAKEGWKSSRREESGTKDLLVCTLCVMRQLFIFFIFKYLFYLLFLHALGNDGVGSRFSLYLQNLYHIFQPRLLYKS